MREKLSHGSSLQEPGEGLQQRISRVRAGLGKNTNPVRELPGAAARLARRRRAGKKQTGRTALRAADALQDASRVTSLPVQTALRRDGACASCPPQVRVRARLGKDTNPVRELPGAAARACGAFSSYLSPFPVWLLLRKSLFICRSCRDGHPIFFSERKWGKRTARGRGSAPFEPPFQRPKVNHLLFLAAGRLSGPSGRKPPADRETLEKPRSRAQLFKRLDRKSTRLNSSHQD